MKKRKSVTLNLRVYPEIKQAAEVILKQLGLPMATAIDMFLRQIIITGGVPFPTTLPSLPEEINTDEMTINELRDALMEGYKDMKAGKVEDAEAAFSMRHIGSLETALRRPLKTTVKRVTKVPVVTGKG